MDRKGGCCIASARHVNMSKMDRIMLRFRPIAPKPASPGGDVSFSGGGVSNDLSRRCDKDGSCRCVKRNGTAGRKRKASSEESIVSSESVSGGETAAVTLPLLAERPTVKERSTMAPQRQRCPSWRCFGHGTKPVAYGKESVVHQAALRPVVVVGSWLKVECITNEWENCDAYGVGRTDEERVANLASDTCPGFVSDGLNRVRWVNSAYRQMGLGEAVTVAEVQLVMEEGVVLPVDWPSFTCRVRVLSGGVGTTVTVPCDAWRMESGGFAWRLDTKAALSLGLLL